MSRAQARLFILICFTLCASMEVHGAPEAPSTDSQRDAMGDLPFGIYPNIRNFHDEASQNDPDTLDSSVKVFSSKIGETVKDVIAHRNATCLGDPCLLQGVPLIYGQPDSNSFFAGAHLQMVDIKKQDPYLYEIEGSVVRSDTQQWLTFLLFDVPQVDFLPFKPRIKLRGNFSRTTETRYYGIGSTLDKTITQPINYYRYADEEQGAQATIIVPITRWDKQRFNLFSSVGSIRSLPSPLLNASKLYQDLPLGANGGVSSHVQVGVQLDSRDTELMTKQGWDLELAAQFSGEPFGQFSFQRYTLIDQRYFTKGQTTLAHRLTVDSLQGQPPFWELTGVGGVDAIEDINGSQILRGFDEGRFHERQKIIESLELRYRIAGGRWFGAYTDVILLPIAFDIARLAGETVESESVGIELLFNKALLVQTFASHTLDGFSLNLAIGQNF